jgi:hypothetical protein
VIAKQNPITFGDAAPHVVAITNAFNNANVELNAIKVDQSSKRQSNDVIAQTVASLLEELTNTVNQVALSPLVAALLPGLDVALAGVLNSLEKLLAGVLNLVATLWVDL